MKNYGATYTYNKMSSPINNNGNDDIKIGTNNFNTVSPTSNQNTDAINQFPSLLNLGHSQKIGNTNLESSRNRVNEIDRERETSNFSNASSSTNIRKTAADDSQENSEKLIPSQLTHQHSNYSISNYPEHQP